ncbi:MAG: DUF2079 domain-containing protein [Chthoniobacterales bacterium]
MRRRLPVDYGLAAALGAALVFFATSTWVSYAHWANFQYRTFDLAYYVQALWQLLHGRFDVSVEGVPLLGNHVEPIVLLLLPFLAVFQHPIVLVVIQNAALATMAPLSFSIGRRLQLSRTCAAVLATVVLLNPASVYVALHEFHPEAFTAPLMLLVIHARLRNSTVLHWLAVAGLLACKENMALLVAAYCAVHLLVERKRPLSELRRRYVWPLVASLGWFALCANFITPALNSGAIDYLALYDRLGRSPGEILIKAFTEPHRWIAALGQSFHEGNLLYGLLVPFLGLPLLRPRWLVIGIPILLQHLLSWRSSEWQIYFHYAAPLIPLFWVAMAEAVAGLNGAKLSRIRFAIPWLVLIACLGAQIVLGPAQVVVSTITEWSSGETERARKRDFIAQIPAAASVVAPLPYLSHLAMRERLYSLHYILKGLKTLSRSEYEPPRPTDFVLIDYEDSATFDPIAGYYHPAMRTVDGRVIPSSERLLHNFLKPASWAMTSTDELTLLQRTSWTPASPTIDFNMASKTEIDANTTLLTLEKSANTVGERGLDITISWNFHGARESFPWMFLQLTSRDRAQTVTLSRGLCAPAIENQVYQEKWHITTVRIPPGQYDAEALFVDNSRRLWAEKSGSGGGAPSIRVSLGLLTVEHASNP